MHWLAELVKLREAQCNALLTAILDRGELCNVDAAGVLGCTAVRADYVLRILQKSGALVSRLRYGYHAGRYGRRRFYRLPVMQGVC